MTGRTLGVMARSLKKNERRLPLHPGHFRLIPAALRDQVLIEHGYGNDFGVDEEQLKPWVGGFRRRDELIKQCDALLQPKPVLSDIIGMRGGQTLLGWPHCVQDETLTQVAIDQSLTLIAFEAMNHWNPDGSFSLHVFHKSDELAGYCSVLHAMQIAGVTGDYGRRPRAVEIGFGATARGAVAMLNALGVHDVDVLTHREVAAVAAPVHSVHMVHFDTDTTTQVSCVVTPGGTVPIALFLAGHDIIVNCVLQNPDASLTFPTDDDVDTLAPGTLIVDVSCDEGMGFSWARPTGFDNPTFSVGDGVLYYGVDHSPSYLWNAATWEISQALLPFLATVVAGPDAWEGNATISRAIGIRDGVIQNPAILSFQGRSPEHRHRPMAT